MKTEAFFYDPGRVYKYIFHIRYEKGGYMKGLVHAKNIKEASELVESGFAGKAIANIKILRKKIQ